jgi:hypothetical protein
MHKCLPFAQKKHTIISLMLAPQKPGNGLISQMLSLGFFGVGVTGGLGAPLEGGGVEEVTGLLYLLLDHLRGVLKK